MGAADLIPGISGGTVALILGVYEPFISALRGFNGQFIRSCMKGQWKEAYSQINLKFFAPLIIGIGTAIAVFVQIIQAVLLSQTYRPLLYSLFFGLVAASACLVWRRLTACGPMHIFLVIAGASAAFFISGGGDQPVMSFMRDSSLSEEHGWLYYGWAFFCGMAGVSAMLMPGISGGYVLNILGMYAPVISALALFIQGLGIGRIDWDSVQLLFALGMGIITGAIVFSRLINWALEQYHDVTIAVLVGFMLGALRSVWPFWNYILDEGQLVNLMNPVLPDFYQFQTWLALGCCSFGFFIVRWAENSSVLKKSRHQSQGVPP